MGVYISLLFGCLFAAFWESNRNPTLFKEYPPRNFALFVLLFILGLIVACRDMIGGTDVIAYKYIFEYTAQQKYVDFSSFFHIGDEMGWTLYNQILARFTDNAYWLFFITGAVSYAMLFRHLKKYADYAFFALLILFCRQYLQSFIYIRQFLSMMIVWWAISYAIDKKPIRFFIICLIAISIHASAAVFVPVYFLSRIKYNGIVIIGSFLITVLIGITPIGNSLLYWVGELIGSEKQQGYAEGLSGWGGHIFYLAEAVGICALLLISKERIYSLGTKYIVLFNIAVGYILLSALTLQNGGLMRFIWVYWIGTAAILPMTCDSILDRNLRFLIKLAICAYFITAFLLYMLRFDGGAFMEPYKTFIFGEF